MSRAKRGWQYEAEKMGGKAFVKAIKDLIDGQKEIIKRLDLSDKHNAERDLKMAEIFKAFPSGDVEGHRAYHETMIEMLNEKRRLRMAIVEKTISGLIWSAIVGIGMAIWFYVKMKMGEK